MRLGSSLRVRPAAATVRAALGVAEAHGITRVTCITRMDRLGVPVHTSIRPRGRVLRVHAGKGLRDVDARAGALMEALEFAVAERAALAPAVRTMAADDWLQALGSGLRLVDFAPRLGRRADGPMPMQRCQRLDDGREAWLPSELVVVDPAFDEQGLFGVSTNGLASGNSVDEATLHGLLEVLERDATTMDALAARSAWIDPATLPPPFAGWAAAWAARGVELIVRLLPSVLGLPCVEAHLVEPASEDVDIAAGAGLHVHPGIALARAVCEAAQSRLSHIHGGRDDIVHFYAARADAGQRDGRAALLARLRDRSRPLPPVDAGRWPADPSAVLARLLARVHAAGLGPVYRHVFPSPGAGLQVVRVVVARAESFHSGGRRMGPRLFAAATAGAEAGG